MTPMMTIKLQQKARLIAKEASAKSIAWLSGNLKWNIAVEPHSQIQTNPAELGVNCNKIPI